MNGYIEAGYGVVLGTLTVYAATLLRRERLARRRLGEPRAEPDTEDESADEERSA